jgi:hypothetical protein
MPPAQTLAANLGGIAIVMERLKNVQYSRQSR